MDTPDLALQFSSSIQRLQWVGGRYLIAYSENDSEVQVFNTETEIVIRFRIEGAAKNGSMDPFQKFFAVSTCDGQVHIFEIPSEESEIRIGSLIKSIKISKQNV